MKKLGLLILALFYPVILFAEDQTGGGSLSFAPPPDDTSVVFLGNIFGVVDGVLHGSGSQIMGTMFGVFNAAVLALGGIVIMYTLMVSTMNTAQEGQMLGQKWSSIWVPIRSTMGLALLVPKASGYCMMQIFIMWVVVQGVGAADKIWDAALGYLNRGGVIIQAQMKPAVSMEADSSFVAKGAMVMLSGQVCMAGIEKILQNQRQSLLNQKANKTGPCMSTDSTGPMHTICETQVPDLISSVNAVAVQMSNRKNTHFKMDMPNLPSSNPYAMLNGICGVITWNGYAAAGSQTYQDAQDLGVRSDNLQTMQLSRAIALQQMYNSLSLLATQIIQNDPQMNSTFVNTGSTTGTKPFSPVAKQAFGVPYNLAGNVCSGSDVTSNQCVSWGGATNTNSAPLFSGTAFQGAIQDYNSVMLPTLNLAQEAKDKKSAQKERKFINEARQQGWIMAGSYFWDLAKLNSSAMGHSNLTDTDTGLDGSGFLMSTLLQAFSGNNECGGKYKDFCTFLDGDATTVKNLGGLMNGSTFLLTPLKQPNPSASKGNSVQGWLKQATETGSVTGQAGSTVFGYIDNSMKVTLPNQPGFSPPAFNFKMRVDFKPEIQMFPEYNFPCGHLAFVGCFGRVLGDIFYNDILRVLLNFLLDLVMKVVIIVIMAFLAVPLLGMAGIFKQGVSVIEQPSVNPIIAMANMGVDYINFSMELWMFLLLLSVSTSAIPFLGTFIFAVISLTFPLLFAWLGIMVSIGFMTAYYIPFVPYMIFTFGSVAWLMAVIEAMVAGPIIALGVTHPEGNEAFGKGEQALMIILNVFLRPAMMVIGYIAAIALSYVVVWLINAGFHNAMSFIQGDAKSGLGGSVGSVGGKASLESGKISAHGYSGWAGIYGFFFTILVYTTLYMTLVQKSFTLITMLPDKVLRFIGGPSETIATETGQWGEEVKGKVQEGSKDTQKASTQMDQKISGYAQKGIGKAKGMMSGGMGGAGGGSVSAGPDSTDSGGD